MAGLSKMVTCTVSVPFSLPSSAVSVNVIVVFPCTCGAVNEGASEPAPVSIISSEE